VKLHFIKHCGTTWLVGINGKDIRGWGSGGELDGTPYLAFGNDEIEKAVMLPEESECPTCGELTKIETSEPV